MDSGRTFVYRKCQPGSQSSSANDSFRYHGWSKNDGCFEGWVPSILLRFSMLRPDLACGVGKAMISPGSTMGVVVNSAFSVSENLCGNPIRANWLSTSAGDSEIICDRSCEVMVASSR